MSNEPTSSLTKIPVAIIGDGCAGLSLAAKAASLPEHEMHVFSPQANAPNNDHVWGYWQMDWLQDIKQLADKTWDKWIIETAKDKIEMKASKHPYQAITRKKWLTHCRSKAKKNGTVFNSDMSLIDHYPADLIFDSRPPKSNANMMVQHFIGWEVQAKAGSFDDSKAILMDFRCDQSQGMHFIYCLPFSDCQALIESTLFSPELLPAGFYETAISDYVKIICKLPEYEVSRRESGVIPLGVLGRHDPGLAGIGANGGAIRPSSGYAFSFIQKQIAHAVTHAVTGKPLPVGVPHSAFELWMDRIFLAVLRRRPDLAPRIFTAMAEALTGDEFAIFLSGEAGAKIWLKVIMAMPKLPFLRGLLHPEPKALAS